jgi:hypothetical protein
MFVGFGSIEIPYNEYLIIPIYLFSEFILIYALLCRASVNSRKFAHWGFCAPWVFLLIIVIPQSFTEPGGLIIVFAFLLIYFIKYPGEAFAQFLYPIKNKYDSSQT